jgi:hypothetical protein
MMIENPTLGNVNTTDHEDCAACDELKDWPCAYHEGFLAGFAEMGRVMRAAVDDPERVMMPKRDAP